MSHLLLGIIICSAALALLAGPALSNEPDREMAACAAKENTVERLACYDAFAASRDVSGPATETKQSGHWTVQTETSKIDDSQSVFLQLMSSDTFQDRFGKELYGTLAIACREKKTDIFFILGEMFLADSGGFGQVTYRIDKRPAVTREFSPSTDNHALGLWNGTGVNLIKRMLDGQRLTIRATPFNENSVTIDFDIAGLSSAITPLRKACGW